MLLSLEQLIELEACLWLKTGINTRLVLNTKKRDISYGNPGIIFL